MLSIYLQNESQRWAAQHRQSYPASAHPSQNDSSSYEDSDCESIFSRGNSRSRRSSISSVASEDAAPPLAFDQPRDFNGAPITMYTSLDQAVTQSTQRVEAEGPRRLVTPGKLYENEEDDDEIIEEDETVQKVDHIASQHPGSAFSRLVSPGVVTTG